MLNNFCIVLIHLACVWLGFPPLKCKVHPLLRLRRVALKTPREWITCERNLKERDFL